MPGGKPALAKLRVAGRMAAWRAHSYGDRGAEGAPEGAAGGGGEREAGAGGGTDEEGGSVRGSVRVEAARVPALRSPRDVLVRVHAASINPLDVAMLDGYGARVLNALRAADGGGGVEFPLVPGRDFVGRVERVGVGAAGAAGALRPGARVWGVVPPHRPGALADFVLVRDAWVGPAPGALDEQAAGGALYAALSACAVLRAAGLPPGPGAAGPGAAGRRGARGRALLLGLGGVGHAALQLLVARGTQVVVGCAREQRGEALRRGALAALDRRHEHYRHELRRAGPYDAVVDCAGLGGAGAAEGDGAEGAGGGGGGPAWGGARYATLSSPLLRATDARGLACGTLSALCTLARHDAAARGWPPPARGSPPPARGSPPSARDASPPASWWSPRVRWAFFSPESEDIETVRRLAEQGKFVVCVERVFAWWEAAAALRAARGGHRRGKLVVDFTAEPAH